MIRRTLAATCLLLATAVASAQAPKPTSVAPDFVRPATGSLIVLLPVEAEAKQLEPGLPLLVNQLQEQLSRGGYRVALLDARNFAVLWEQEATAAGGLYDPITGRPRPDAIAKALNILAQRVSQGTSASLVVKARLVVREATLTGTKADWDGQSRRVLTRGLAGASFELRGTTPALSVEVLALTDVGAFAFRNFGGASLAYVMNVGAEQQQFREDLFSDSQELREGTAIALRPLFPAKR
jgi:hypothetical protein